MSSRRIVMTEYGPPAVLRWEEAPARALKRDEIRIRTVAAAINHSDLEIRSGAWPILRTEPFPYVPGLEVVGEIAELGTAVSGCAVGDRVITMMQGLGGVRAERDGGYADEVIVAADAVAVVGADVDLIELAAIGLAGVTAAEGLRRIVSVSNGLDRSPADASRAILSSSVSPLAPKTGASEAEASSASHAKHSDLGPPAAAPREVASSSRTGAASEADAGAAAARRNDLGSLAGRSVLVSGAGGGVGSAAVAIARTLGARVTAIVSRVEQCEHVFALGASEVVVARTAEQLQPQLRPGSFDGVLDCVAGPLFPALVNALRRHGTLSLVGAVGGSKVALEAYDLLLVTLTGYSSEDLDGPSLRRAIEPITGAMRAKALPAPSTTVLPLREAARAHEMLERHEVSGRIVLVPT